MPTKRAQVVRLLLWALVLGISGMLSSAEGMAQPLVRVGSGSRLELEASRAAHVVRARGTLTDDQGRGVEGALIWLSAERAEDGTILDRRSVRTTEEGFAELEIESPQVLLRLRARFDGDRYHSAAEADASIDTAREPVALTFIAPASGLLDLGSPAHEIVIRARSEVGGARLEVQLQDELGRELARGTTDDDGMLRAELPSSTLGEPGSGKLVATSVADGRRSQAREEIAVMRFRSTQLALTLSPRGRSRIRVAGALQANAAGIAHATIGLFDDNGQHVASVETDQAGKLDQEIDLADLGAANPERRTVLLQGRYVSSVPWLGSSDSVPIEVSLGSGQKSDLAWLLGTPLACLLLLAWLRKRRLDSSSPPLELANIGAGIALARSSHSTLVAAPELAVTVIVLDAKHGGPVAGSLASVATEPGRIEARSGANGELRIEAIPRGVHRVRFEAPGYRAIETSLRVPHRGEWTNAVVRLESLRDIAVRSWSQVAMRVWRSEERARATTVRETLERAPSATERSDLLDRTERAAYGRSIPSESEVQSIEDEAAMLTEARNGEPPSVDTQRPENEPDRARR